MNLLDLMIQKGIQLRKAGTTHGGEYQGPCPWCGGTDRFHVWPHQQETDSKGRAVQVPGRYWCRPGIGHCGRNGDAIQFLVDYEHLTFKEACARLGQKYDQVEQHRYPKERLTTADGRPPQDWQPADRQSPKAMWAREAAQFMFKASEHIFETPEALGYLAGRGIREETVLEHWLGWNPGTPSKEPGGKTWGVFKKREDWGLLPERDEKTGKAKPLWLPIGWVIPYIAGADVVRLRIRQPDGSEFGPRYYMVPGSSSATMVIEPCKPGHRDVYVIVESELDAILISQEASDVCGAMALGSASTRPDRIAAAKLDKAAHILNALDADSAGAHEAGKWWKEHYPDAVRWPVPEGKDPGDYYKAKGNIREWIMEGLPEGLKPKKIRQDLQDQ